MANWRIFALALSLAAGAALGARASGTAFNIRPGLWEVTVKGSSSGMPRIPPEALARMTPEQRARFEAAMRAAVGRGLAPHLIKNCVTADELRRLPNFAPNEGKACTRTVLKRTATEIEFRLECTRGQKLSGIFHYRAPNPETITGSVDMTTGNGVHTARIRDQVRGRWLGPHCGSVKPRG